MTKRIILIFASLLAVSMILLFFRQLNKDLESGPLDPEYGVNSEILDFTSGSGKTITGPDGIRIGGIEGGFVFNKPGKYKAGFDRRVSESENKLEFSKPWVILLNKKKTYIKITADSLWAAVNDYKEGSIPTRGTLEGNVCLSFMKIEKNGSSENELLEIQVKMDSVVYEQEFSQVTSDGLVEVTGAKFSASGKYLEMQYDQINERLQFLKLQQLNELRFTKSLNSLSKTTANKPDKKPTQTPVASTSKKPKSKPKSKTATYSLDIFDNVVILQGAQKVTADAINILVDFDPSDSINKAPETDVEPTDVEPSNESPDRSIAHNDTNEPITTIADPNENPVEETIITASGPLQITTMEDIKPLENNQKRLKLTISGKPAKIWQDNELAIKANTIVYDDLKKTMQLTGDPFVWLALGTPKQFAQAPEIVVDLKDKQLGQIKTKGLTEIYDDDTKITTHSTLMTFYPKPKRTTSNKTSNTKDKYKKLSSPLKSIQIAQCVIKDPNSESYLDNLIANFDLDKSGEQSQLANILTSGALDIDTPKYSIKITEPKQGQLVDPNMLLVFAPAKDPNANIDKNEKAKSLAGMGDLFGKSQLVSANINAPGGSITLKDKVKNFAITSQQLIGHVTEGDIFKAGQWTITGADSQIDLADHGHLLGNEIKLDLAKGICDIPGKGSMELKSDTNLTGEKTKEPTDIAVTWNEGALYSIDSDTMTFKNVDTRITGQTKQGLRQSVLTCPIMEITLETPDDPNKSSDANNAVADNSKLDENKDLKTLKAIGSELQEVKLTSKQHDPISNEITSLMQMQSNELIFDKQSEHLIAKGEGWIELLNTPSQKVEPNSITDNGQAVSVNVTPEANTPDSSLPSLLSNSVSSEPGYTMIHFLDTMTFDIKNENIHFINGIALHQLPIKFDPNVQITQLTPPDILEDWPKGRSQLFCDDLKVVSQKDASTQPADPNSISHILSDIGYMHAKGNIVFETAPDDLKRIFFSSNSITINNVRKPGEPRNAIIRGTESTPARIIDPSKTKTTFSWIKYNLETGASEGHW